MYITLCYKLAENFFEKSLNKKFSVKIFFQINVDYCSSILYVEILKSDQSSYKIALQSL